MKSALLLSGGIDSTALAVLERPDIAFTIDYGQRSAAGEIRAAKQISKELSIPHQTIRVDCSDLGSGDLSGSPALACAPESEWWPYRNQLLVTLACMKAIAIGVERVVVGSVRNDSFHVDGKAEFYMQLNRTVSMQEGKIFVDVPGIQMTTVELVQKSGAPLSLLGWTHSCHKAPYACGNCRGCWKRQSVMVELFDENRKAC